MSKQTHEERDAHEDVAILLLEMQPQIVAFSRTQPEADLRRAAAATRRIADALQVPMFASTVALGAEAPTLVTELAGLDTRTRAAVSPFGDADIRGALRATGRWTLAVGGVSTEIAVLRSVLDACRQGYEVHVLADLCGGLDPRTEATAFEQMRAAGATLSNVSSFFTGLVDDMASPAWQAVNGGLSDLWRWNAPG